MYFRGVTELVEEREDELRSLNTRSMTKKNKEEKLKGRF